MSTGLSSLPCDAITKSPRVTHLLPSKCNGHIEGLTQWSHPQNTWCVESCFTHRPLHLAVSDALSVLGKCCNIRDGSKAIIRCNVQADTIDEIWETTITFLQWYHATDCASKREAGTPSLIGCFVSRESCSSFDVGLITHDRAAAALLDEVSARWITFGLNPFAPSSPPILQRLQRVPVLERLRQLCRLTVTWDRSRRRVFSGHTIPPFRVAIEVPLPFTPHVAVRIFACRPSKAILMGTLCVDPTEQLPVLNHAKGTCTWHLLFDNVALGAEGEHLLAFETVLAEGYCRFFSPLTCTIPPFRVVSPDEDVDDSY